MDKKKVFSGISMLSLSAFAAAALITAPMAVYADNHDGHKESGDSACSGDKGCSGDKEDKGDKKCSGDKEDDHDHGDKSCGGSH